MNRTTWREGMLADLLVPGMSKRTQEAYLRSVRQLQDYYNNTDPKQLSEQQVKDYLLRLRTEKRAAPGTLRIASRHFAINARQRTRPELIDWTVPVLRSSTDAGPKSPTCGEPLTFEPFIRIRPPPLELRGRNFD